MQDFHFRWLFCDQNIRCSKAAQGGQRNYINKSSDEQNSLRLKLRMNFHDVNYQKIYGSAKIPISQKFLLPSISFIVLKKII